MYLSISIIVLVISFLLFKKAAGSLSFTKLNMISWVFFYNIILQSFISAVLVVNNWVDHYAINRVTNQDTRYYAWLAVMYTSIAMPIGMLLVNFIIGKSTNSLLSAYTNEKIVPLFSKQDSYIKVPLFILSAISILATFYTLFSLPSIGILKVIQGASAYELAVFRMTASRDFTGNHFIKNIFAINLVPVLTFIWYAYYKYSNSRRDYRMFIVMFIFTFLILTYNLEKSPFISFLLGFLFFRVLIYGEIQKKYLRLVAIAGLGILILMYVYITGTSDILSLFSEYNSGILGRVFLGQSAGTYLMFDIFPKNYDFIGFSSISTFVSDALNLEHSERAARITMEHFTHESLETAGVMNTLFIGEAWANFGFAGVIIAPIFVGFIIQALFIRLITLKKTPLLLGVLVYFSYKSSVTGGFNDYLYNATYVIIFILIFMVYFFASGLKK